MVPSERLDVAYYLHTIVTVAVSCIISQIKLDIFENRDFCIPRLYLTPPLVGAHKNIAIALGVGKTRGAPTQSWTWVHFAKSNPTQSTS